MLKNLTGGAIINYGDTLPDAATSYDGALFYKTGGNQGLYVFGFVMDSDPNTPGDQSAQGWNLVQSPELYVNKKGDIMTGALGVTGGNVANDPYGRISVTMPTDSNSYAYYGMTRVGQSTWSLGIDTSNRFFIGIGLPGTMNNVPSRYFSFSADGTILTNGNTVWHSGNDGVGTNLDAGLFAGQPPSFYTNAENISSGTLNLARLPYTPVRQNGSNSIAISWSGSQLGVSVDSTNFGTTWPINISGVAATATFATTSTNSTNAVEATSARYIHSGGTQQGVAMSFTWYDPGGAPAYIWGGTQQSEQRVYSPANLSVGYATNAGAANTATNATNSTYATEAAYTQYVRNGRTGEPIMFTWDNPGGAPTWLWGGNQVGDQRVYAPAALSVGYATNAGTAVNSTNATNATNATKLANFTVGSRSDSDFNSYRSSGMYAGNGQPGNSPGQYLSVIAAANLDVGLQIAGGYSSDSLFFRGWSDSGANFGTWRAVVHSGNIGSQSVNYANSAGSANTANIANSLVTNANLTGTTTAARIIAGPGTAAAPAFTLSEAATDTGFFSGGDGYINFASNGAYCGQIQPGGNLVMIGNITAYSDRNIKKDIENIKDALAKVKALNGVTYTRIDNEQRGTGLIAQDLQAVLPEAVSKQAFDGMLTVAYGNVVGLLVESIKELSGTVDELKKEIAELKAGNNGN